jgi:hypothetical protein
MKMLRNRFVVPGLAFVAVAVVAYSFHAPRWKTRVAAKAATALAPTGKAATPVAVVPTTPAPPPKVEAEASQPIDRAYAQSHFAQWLDTPARDPFQMHRIVQPKRQEVVRAADRLKLKAIWRQSGGSLAVVNDQVLAEGEEIQGFKIERIESEQVWVKGQGESERIGFTTPQTAGASFGAPGAGKPL